MTTTDTPPETPSDRPWGILGGRSERGEYWLSILGLFALNVVLNLVFRNPLLTSFISLPIWIVIATRRLHDFNRSGWWSLIPFAIGFFLGFVGAVAPIPMVVKTLINLGATAAAVFIIGFKPGDDGPNRFGEPVKLPDPA